MAGPRSDPGRVAISAGWGARAAVETVPLSVLEWGLGAGESSVIALALCREGAEVVLDDAQARRCARVHGLEVVGTLGLVVRAASSGAIASAALVIQDLRAAGLHLDDTLIRDVLDRALREGWGPRGSG